MFAVAPGPAPVREPLRAVRAEVRPEVAVSVVVPFRNARSRLPRLLAALEAQTSKQAAELLFVDDRSSDGGADWLREHLPDSCRVLSVGRRGGSYAARNVGIESASGQVLAFTDADCVPEPRWLEQGLRASERSQRVAGRITIVSTARPTFAEELDASRFLLQERFVRESFGATANLFVRRSVFESVGLFDERLVSGGDQELGARATAAGLPIEFEPGAVVCHPARRRLGDLLAKAHRVGRGFGQCVFHHSPSHAGAAQRVSDRLALILEPDASAPREKQLALAAGQTLLAAGTIAGCLRGYLGNYLSRDSGWRGRRGP